MAKNIMTNAEQELLFLIADMVFATYCATCADTCGSTEEYFAITNPIVEKLHSLRLTILAKKRHTTPKKRRTMNHRKRTKKRLRPRRAFDPDDPDVC